MYEGWRLERWETPVSDAESVGMVSLADGNEGLAITLDARDSRHRWHRWRLVFERHPAYRNIMEEFRLELWRHRDETGQRCGWTFVVPDSPWVAAFKLDEELLEVWYPTIKHFVISTEDDVVEVLSPEPPRVEDLGPTPNEGSPERPVSP
jgi:hypothetical protein